MIRRAWESKNFSKVVALLALFVALGGQALGAPKFTFDTSDHPEAAQIGTQKQLDALLNAMLDSFKQKGGVLTSDMIHNGAVKSDDIHANTINSGDIKPKSLFGNLLKPNTITGFEIKPDSVSGDVLKDKTITEQLLKDQAVSAQKLKNQTITESKLKPNSITSTAINEQQLTGVEKCTGGLHGPFGDVCTTDLQPAATWDTAELNCDAMGLRLPTITEGLRALSTFGAAQSIWTDEIYGAENTVNGRVAMRRVFSDGIVLDAHEPGDSVGYRCVIKSSSST